MKFKILNKASYKTTQWSGGDTTEFYIYPEKASYSRKDFLFRISSAAVNLERSVFTKLERTSRKLMLLSGDIELVHKGKYSKKLKLFEQDSFMGDWSTESYGIARDFNLMTRGNCTGELKHIEVLSNSEAIIELKTVNKNECIEVLYSFDNDIYVHIGEQEILLNKEECIIIYKNKCDLDCNVKFKNYTKTIANIIVTTISL